MSGISRGSLWRISVLFINFSAKNKNLGGNWAERHLYITVPNDSPFHHNQKAIDKYELKEV
jgi:hypothetical protein